VLLSRRAIWTIRKSAAPRSRPELRFDVVGCRVGCGGRRIKPLFDLQLGMVAAFDSEDAWMIAPSLRNGRSPRSARAKDTLRVRGVAGDANRRAQDQQRGNQLWRFRIAREAAWDSAASRAGDLSFKLCTTGAMHLVTAELQLAGPAGFAGSTE